MYRGTLKIKPNKITGKKITGHVFGCGFTLRDYAVFDAQHVDPMFSYMLASTDVPVLGRIDPDTVDMSSFVSMFRAFLRVFCRMRDRCADTDNKKPRLLSKISVLKNRLIDADIDGAGTCLICWEPITTSDCIVSTCCFTVYCYQCAGAYFKRFESERDDLMLVPVITPCCGLFSMLPRYCEFSGNCVPTKWQKLRETMCHFSGANVVIYIPRCSRQFAASVGVRAEDVYDTSSPFQTDRVIVVSDKSPALSILNWRDASVFVDTSEVENSPAVNSGLINIVVHVKIYYKLKYDNNIIMRTTN